MSASSKIEWTDATWNPVTGCTRVSPGCAHCYIERTPPFRMAGRRFDRSGSTGVVLHPERLEQPLRWEKPRRVFVNSLSDLFHEDVPSKFIFDVFVTMASAPQHVFQVLTKRPERALEWFASFERRPVDERSAPLVPPVIDVGRLTGTPVAGWPLPNVWIGVSIENARHTWRADVLRAIPAAVRFISAEPLLGRLFAQDPPRGANRRDADPDGRAEAPAVGQGTAGPNGGQGSGEVSPARANDGNRGERRSRSSAPLDLAGIDWVIAGGESGPGARPMHPDWARELRDACLAQCKDCAALGSFVPDDWRPEYQDDRTHWAACERHTAFFFKQWGEWAPYAWKVGDRFDHSRMDAFKDDGRLTWVERVGKKRAGRLLDGRTWDEMPGAGRRGS